MFREQEEVNRLFINKQYIKAYLLLKNIIETSSTNDSFIFDYASICAYKCGKNKEALNFIKEAVKIDPNNYEIVNNLDNVKSL